MSPAPAPAISFPSWTSARTASLTSPCLLPILRPVKNTSAPAARGMKFPVSSASLSFDVGGRMVRSGKILSAPGGQPSGKRRLPRKIRQRLSGIHVASDGQRLQPPQQPHCLRNLSISHPFTAGCLQTKASARGAGFCLFPRCFFSCILCLCTNFVKKICINSLSQTPLQNG